MKFLFIVQGEGRGHLTQAVALAQIVENEGHEVVGALVGSCISGTVQPFFQNSFSSEIIPFTSPGLVYSQNKLSIKKTLSGVLLHFKSYIKSLFIINRVVKEKKPDVIINFYDSLAGLHQILFSKNPPMICVAHQYLMLHKYFIHPEGNRLNRVAVNFNSRITALGSCRKLALSFYEGESDEQRDIYLIPPLLREEAKDYKISKGNFFLAYVSQKSIINEIIDWQHKNADIEIHCFLDHNYEEDIVEVSPNLFFHKVNTQAFLSWMSRSKGLISTAGFESVCEAMLMGKPVLMVPMKNHYEQTCNAIDAERSGVGIYATAFDVTRLIDYLPLYKESRNEFMNWQNQSHKLFYKHIYEIAPQPTIRYSLKKMYSQTKSIFPLKSTRILR